MKNYEAKPMNAFQKARAPHAVQDEAIAEQKERMADEGIFYRDSTYCEELTHPDTGVRQKVFFDTNSGKWIAEFHFPDDSTSRIEADSRIALTAAIAAGHAQTVVDAQEAEREANPVFDSEWAKTVHDWTNGCKFGKEFSVWSEVLSESRLDEVCNLIRDKAYRMFHAGAKLDARNIEAAYVELLDAGTLEEFENEAANIKSSREFIATHPSEQEILSEDLRQRSEAGYERAMSAYESEEDLKRLQGDKKLASSKKGLAELRRRALFGSKENAFPVSTGTAKRV